ncbi:MAG: phosphatase PAP2 family protein [Thermoleophilia bacterium]|nr:phosphatase PAP2 family protein [Thermoleophilia bacterium]
MAPTADTEGVIAAPIPGPSRLRRIGAALHRLGTTYPYVITTVGLTLVFVLTCYTVSWQIGIPVRDPEGTLLGRRMVSPILLMFLFAMLDSAYRAIRTRRRGSREPFARLTWSTFIDRWWWKRLVLATLGFLSFAFTYLAYRNLKSFVSLINYRSYDQEMLSIDKWMSFGHDPAQVLHDTLGTGFAAYLLSWVYLSYIPLIAVFVSASLAFMERMREAYVYVASMMWCWILGTVSYYVIPTLGPFASRPSLFSTLPATNVEKLQRSLENTRFELHSDNIGQDIVGGIAGFASLHIGVVVAILFLMRYYRKPALVWATAVFLVPTAISTIYFGWHFLLDDFAGFFIGWFSVLLGRATVYPRLLLVWKRGGQTHAHPKATAARV